METLAEYGRQILALVVVFSLLGLTVWKLGRRPPAFSGQTLLRKFLFGKFFLGKPFARKARSAEAVLEVVERLVLTPQHTLHVLRLRGREMLVATHPQGCALLHGAPDRLDRDSAARGAGA